MDVNDNHASIWAPPSADSGSAAIAGRRWRLRGSAASIALCAAAFAYAIAVFTVAAQADAGPHRGVVVIALAVINGAALLALSRHASSGRVAATLGFVGFTLALVGLSVSGSF